MKAPKLSLVGPSEMAGVLANRTRSLRLLKGWTQRTLAQRAGVSTASLRRFETSGKASLELLLKVAAALARLDEFDQLLQPPPVNSIDELEHRNRTPERRRGRF
jgi:transcriptional regulator with XRE-family HTH domain